jgi:hypothetical protein
MISFTVSIYESTISIISILYLRTNTIKHTTAKMGNTVSNQTTVIVYPPDEGNKKEIKMADIASGLDNLAANEYFNASGNLYPSQVPKGDTAGDTEFFYEADPGPDGTIPIANIVANISALTGKAWQDDNTIYTQVANLVASLLNYDGRCKHSVFIRSGYMAYALYSCTDASNKKYVFGSLIFDKESGKPKMPPPEHAIYDIRFPEYPIVHKLNAGEGPACKDFSVSLSIIRLDGTICLVPPHLHASVYVLGIHVTDIDGDISKGITLNINVGLASGFLQLKLNGKCLHVSGSITVGVSPFSHTYNFNSDLFCM